MIKVFLAIFMSTFSYSSTSIKTLKLLNSVSIVVLKICHDENLQQWPQLEIIDLTL